MERVLASIEKSQDVMMQGLEALMMRLGAASEQNG